MTGYIVSIHRVAEAGGPVEPVTSVRLDEGKGIVGDRYYGVDELSQVTLVDAGRIARVNDETGWSIRPEETRRNIVTSGIDLNQWETGRFRVGGAILEGVELCEPCATLGNMLRNDARTPADIVRALAHGAGLRARVIRGAEISVGDPVSAE